MYIINMYEQLLPILSIYGNYVNTILLIIHQHYSHKNIYPTATEICVCP